MIKTPNSFLIKSKVKEPMIIKVIKKKELYNTWWSPDKNKYYSSLLNDKQFIYSFLNERSADNCLNFIKKYKKLNGIYPNLTENSNNNTCSLPDDELFIDDELLKGLKSRCLINNIGLIGISHFDYTFIDSFFGKKNVFNLNISAVDLLENEEIDIDHQVDNLNYLLDFN